MRGVGNIKGQVTVFIILALVIVVAGVLIYTLSPKLKNTSSSFEDNPKAYIQDCLEDEIELIADNLSLQGGSLNPSLYYRYQSNNIGYLCHTHEDGKFCAVQIPFLKQHIESEIKGEISGEVASCFQSLKENYEKKGYDVNIVSGTFEVEILPNRILTTINNKLTVSKDSTKTYDEFNVVLNNNLYELISITNSILEKETYRYGDVDILTYMVLYDNLKLYKLKQLDDTKIYILEDKETGKKFQFASRSMTSPAGFIKND